MKKYLAIALAAAIICSFAGCGETEPTGGSAVTTTAETTVTTTETEAETTVETTTEETTIATTEETTAPETTTVPETTAVTTTEATTVPETTTAAPETTTEPAEPTNAYREAILKARTEEMNNAMPVFTTPVSPFLFEMLGITEEQMSEYALSVSMMNIKAYGVAVIKPAEGSEQAVLDGVNGFVEQQKKNFEFYLADQYEIANNAIVETTKDGLVILVMCEDAETVYKAILDNLK